MIPFSIVVAMDQTRGIGREGKLPWHLKCDLRHFKEITTKTRDKNKRNAVIMGRKTWDSLPSRFRPLPDRINVVITRNENLEFPEGVSRADGLDQALELLTKGALSKTVEGVYVIGGAQIFEQAIVRKECRRIYLTQILQTVDCDTFFPPFADHFQHEVSSPRYVENEISCFFAEYSRKMAV
jgi:dihydrofolate reductase/thymidylate synthase